MSIYSQPTRELSLIAGSIYFTPTTKVIDAGA
jgi:hypothetical protein